MRFTAPFAGICTLALTLAACREQPTVPPGERPSEPAAPQADGPAPASAQARADFAKAAQAYVAARKDGALSPAECEAVTGEFSRVYRSHGASLAIAEFNAGVVWEECGQPERAETIYSGLVAAVPAFDLPYNNLGVLLWKKGQEDRALELFRQGVERGGLMVRAARNNVAGLLRDRYVERPDGGVFGEAETATQTVLAVDTSNKAAYENLARLYYDRGLRKDRSYLVLANLVVSQGMRVLKDRGVESADLYNTQGLLLLERNDQVSALRAFKEAARIEPSHVEASLNIGFISIRFRDYATAEAAFAAALRSPRQQRNIEVWLALGVAQRGLKKYKECEASYQQAIKLDAADPRAYFNLGVLYQDHIAVQSDVSLERSVELGEVARKHYRKFAEVAGKNRAYAERLLVSQDRIAILDENRDIARTTAELEEQVRKLAVEAEAADRAERERLIKLEQQAMAAEQAGAAPAPTP
ncbi:MAG: tetratricopeptide repeat protein [Myxococcales bacterium]|nr:tetratricopeptide repeat protein [Myxococcales bacterium]